MFQTYFKIIWISEREIETMTASFTVYINESGDVGFVFRSDERGGSRWLVLSAAMFRKSNEIG